MSVTVTCSATTSPTCSPSSSWASAKMLSSCPCLRAAGCSRPAPAAPRRSTCSSSPRRATCAGTRWASTWRWRCRWTTWRSRRATRGSDPGQGPHSATGKLLEQNSRAARCARSTTAPPGPTSPCGGRRRWRVVASVQTLGGGAQANESAIVAELVEECQGAPVDLGGYWLPDERKCVDAMAPARRSTRSSTSP